MIFAKKEVIGHLLKGAALCTFLVALVIGIRFMLHRSLQRRICSDLRFQICQLIEIPEEPVALRSGTIEKLLGLQIGTQNLFAFDIASAERILTSHPLIETARLWRCPPCAIAVSYRVRRPFAELCEWPGLLIDQSGHLFPYHPHFTPKQLPKLFLGLKSCSSDRPHPILSGQERGILRGEKTRLALEILHFLNTFFADEGTHIASLDVSLAYDGNLGKRGIALVLKDRVFVDGKPLICRRHLRLSAEQWRAQLDRYRTLLLPLAREELRMVQKSNLGQLITSSKQVNEEIDLRLPQLAHLKLRVEEQGRFD